jgi:polyphosphate:AMP phosphotransferase
MFEAAELGNAVSKEALEARAPALRVDLINAQYDLRHADFPVVVLLTGDDRAGVNETLNVLHEWMDARYIQTTAYGELREAERERPRFWRYWDALPRKGQLAILVGDWSTALLTDHMMGDIDEAEFERGIDHIQRLEQQLVDDGALILKFWIHLPRKELKRRLRKAKKNSGSVFRSEEIDRRVHAGYDEILEQAERLIRKTSTAAAPWHVVEGSDSQYRDLSVAEGILAALRARLDAGGGGAIAAPAIALPDLDPQTNVLGSVDLSKSLPYDEYKATLNALQERLRETADRARRKGVPAILVFEGWDAAGKGGAIRRIMTSLDARDYRTVPISAPTEEEKAHHYLWRFWRQIPRNGQIMIFDRSWYGRVLVERVEGFAKDAEWRRAFAEINDFEDQLVEHGAVVCKFWLHIGQDEQSRRFEAREKTAYKKYKIGEEDYRNRGKWDDYVAAVDEMVARTSGELAPWHLIPANDKRFARVAIVRTVCEALRAGVKRA